MAAAECPATDSRQALYRDCRSWCSARFAAQQCLHCNCKACGWCAPAPPPPPPPLLTATALHAPSTANAAVAASAAAAQLAVGAAQQQVNQLALPALEAAAAAPTGAECSATDPRHALYADCRPWCQAKYASEQCGHCNCRRCDWCVQISSTSPPPPPPPASSADSVASTAADACTSTDPHHALFRDCRAWCQAKYAAEQCGHCSCKRCAFCAALVSPPPPRSPASSLQPSPPPPPHPQPHPSLPRLPSPSPSPPPPLLDTDPAALFPFSPPPSPLADAPWPLPVTDTHLSFAPDRDHAADVAAASGVYSRLGTGGSFSGLGDQQPSHTAATYAPAGVQGGSRQHAGAAVFTPAAQRAVEVDEQHSALLFCIVLATLAGLASCALRTARLLTQQRRWARVAQNAPEPAEADDRLDDEEESAASGPPRTGEQELQEGRNQPRREAMDGRPSRRGVGSSVGAARDDASSRLNADIDTLD